MVTPDGFIGWDPAIGSDSIAIKLSQFCGFFHALIKIIPSCLILGVTGPSRRWETRQFDVLTVTCQSRAKAKAERPTLKEVGRKVEND